MALWTEVVTPLELTTVARLSAAEREREKGALAQFLPNQMVNDTVVRLNSSENGLVEAAEYRAFDAETTIGATPGGKRVTVELLPLGQKVRVSEFDQLRQRGTASPELVKNSVAGVAVRVGQAVADRMELLRGQVLTTGKATIDENGLNGEQDYDRDSAMSVTAANSWSEADNGKPIDDLLAWVEAYTDANGEAPETLLLSTKALTSLGKSAQLRGLTGLQSAPTVVSRQFVIDQLAAFGLPNVQVYDRKVRVNGKAQRVIAEDTALLLPAGGSDLGATFWGNTLESTDPLYGLADDDRPGIAVGAHQEYDPMGVWVHAAAIGMPILANANLSMAAKVLF